ncbi:MAG: carboxypeptidase regulatory-like domain-containing protein [Candidatus Riflebacteria bacterium]|nr:carboxypeptidase regulatory-like domain-containing protein [Candidatus Riflebacteria bacterium]
MGQVLALFRTRSVLIYVIAVLCGLGIGVGCGPQPDLLLPEPTARIKGVVLDQNLARVPAAKVFLEPVRNPPCRCDTYTKVDGSFELPGICPGLYDVVATALVGGEILRTRLRFIQLSAGQIALIPDLVLKAGSTVTGRVLLQGRADHSGTTVTLVGTNRTATTNATGDYSVTNVEEGTYAVNYTHDGFIENTIAAAAVGRHFVFDNLPLSTYSLTLCKTDFFCKTVGPLTMVPGSTSLVVPQIQLDSHRVANTRTQAFELEHSPNGSQIVRANNASPAVGELALTDPTVQIFDQLLTRDAHVTPFAGLSWSPDTRDLLFVRSFSSPASTSSIGTCRSDGTGVRNLLPVDTQYLHPSWAPDGQSFVYFLNPNIRRMLVDRSTGSLVATTSTSAIIDTLAGVVTMSGMEWSPTGRVYYSYSLNGGSGLRSAGIFTVFSAGGGRLQITPRTRDNQTISTPESPTLRPDGAKIAFAWRDPPATNEPPNGIYTMDLDGTNATRITTVPGINLDWAPDATRVIFTKAPTDPQFSNRIHEVLVPR